MEIPTLISRPEVILVYDYHIENVNPRIMEINDGNIQPKDYRRGKT